MLFILPCVCDLLAQPIALDSLARLPLQLCLKETKLNDVDDEYSCSLIFNL